MKIDAVRLAQFRRFVEPVAVEDLAPGVNVLAGPNEMGKSTVFRALEAAFLTRHKVTGGVLNAMRPVSGGEPLVEADFTVDGTRWRIRKQFGRSSTAILSDAATGRSVARNAEAEEQLAHLIGRPEDIAGTLGLVWVRQQRALAPPDPDYDSNTSRQKGSAELNALQAAVRGEIEAAAAGEDLQRVQALTAKALDVLLTPTRNAARKNGPLDRSRHARDDARQALDRARNAAAASAARLADIEHMASELAAATAPEAAARRKEAIESLAKRLVDASRQRSERELLRQTLRARELERASAAQAVASAAERGERISRLDAQIVEAKALQAEIAKLSGELNADPATPQRFDQLRTQSHARDLARAEMTSASAIVSLNLKPEASGRVKIAGEAVSHNAMLEVSETLKIDIEGIGTISITPPGADSMAAVKARAAAAENAMKVSLQALAVATLEEAAERVAGRAKKVEALDRARARLFGIAPKGVSELEAERASLAQVASSAVEPAALVENLKSAEAAEHVARASLDELAKAALDDEAFAALNMEFERVKADNAAAAQAAARLAQKIENLKSEQAGADEDGLAGEVDTLKGTLDRYDDEVKRLEAEGKALLLLAETLAGIEGKVRDRVFEPLSSRLQPYLSEVFGAADLSFRDSFVADSLTRDGERHDFAILSDGTREQLSVLVRVAYAELLSEKGTSVPLVLDDPLVYSDDSRLESLSRVLARTSQKLQVVLLTCRPHAFEKLSGRRVSLTAWRPD